MHVVIDLFGEGDLITIQPAESPEEIKQKDEMRKLALEEIFRRAPQPQVIPITNF